MRDRWWRWLSGAALLAAAIGCGLTASGGVLVPDNGSLATFDGEVP